MRNYSYCPAHSQQRPMDGPSNDERRRYPDQSPKDGLQEDGNHIRNGRQLKLKSFAADVSPDKRFEPELAKKRLPKTKKMSWRR